MRYNRHIADCDIFALQIRYDINPYYACRQAHIVPQAYRIVRYIANPQDLYRCGYATSYIPVIYFYITIPINILRQLRFVFIGKNFRNYFNNTEN